MAAESICHMTRHPPIAAWQPNFGDKGIAVKSERRKGVSLRALEWSSSYYTFYWPFWLLKQPRYRQHLPGFLLAFLSFLFCSPLQPMQGCCNTYIQVSIIRQSSLPACCLLLKCWETRLTVSASVFLHGLLHSSFCHLQSFLF